MLDDRLENRRRPLLAFRAKFVRAFHDGPAVVAAFLDLVDHLPQILADFAAPKVAGPAIEAEAPQLAQAVGVDFGPGLVPGSFLEGYDLADERIVLRDAVRLAGRRIIDIDAQQLGEDARQILADVVCVGDAGAVAGDDVEIAVGAELQAAAVVAAIGPFKDDLLGRPINHRRLRLHMEPRDARAFRQAFFGTVGNPGHVGEAVVLELGMERESVDDLLFALGVLQLQREIGLVGVLVIDERPDFSIAAGDEQAIRARCVGEIERLLELRQLRKRQLRAIRRRRLRRTDHLRRAPRHALLEPELLPLRLLAGLLRRRSAPIDQKQTDADEHCTNQPATHHVKTPGKWGMVSFHETLFYGELQVK